MYPINSKILVGNAFPRSVYSPARQLVVEIVRHAVVSRIRLDASPEYVNGSDFHDGACSGLVRFNGEGNVFRRFLTGQFTFRTFAKGGVNQLSVFRRVRAVLKWDGLPAHNPR